MFPTLSEAVTGRAAHGRAAVLQQVDAADRPHPAVPDRRRAAARVAQVDAVEPARAVHVAGAGGASSPAVALGRARRARLAVGHLLRALRVRRRHDRARSSGAARACARARPAPIIFTALIGLVGAQQAPLRRLHRPRRHRADVPRLRRRTASSRTSRCCSSRASRPRSGSYTIRNDGVKVTDDGQKQMITGHLTVFADGKEIEQAVPGASGSTASTSRSRRPRSRSAAAPAEDLYIVLRRVRPRRTQTATPADRRSTRWSTGSGSASASWRSAPASRCCRSTAFAFALAKLPAARHHGDAGADARAPRCAPAVGAAHRGSEGRAGRAEERGRKGPPEARSSACAARAAGSWSASARAADAAEMRAEIANLVKRGRRATRSFSTTSRSTAARSRWPNRSTRASTASPGCSPMSWGRVAP